MPFSALKSMEKSMRWQFMVSEDVYMVSLMEGLMVACVTRNKMNVLEQFWRLFFFYPFFCLEESAFVCYDYDNN